MASTYTNDLRLELIATGEAAATWGDKTNVNLTNIAAAFGYATQDGFAANADSTTTVADGVADPARAMYFKVTSSATLTATRTLTIAPNTISRVMWIENATTGGQSIAISQGTGANVTIPTGKTAVVYLDGAGSGAAVVDAMAGVSSGASDTLAEILAAGNTTGGTDLAVSTGDDITFADSSKAIFGAGSDLQIYHDGGNSRIVDSGTGILAIQASSQLGIYNADATQVSAEFVNDGKVGLRFSGAEKLATSASGISVTGSVTADGLSVDGDSTLDALELTASSSFPATGFSLNANGFLYGMAGSQGFILRSASNSKALLNISENNDISFYEDTGTTPKMVWSASAERLSVPTLSITDGSITTTAAAGDHTVFNSTGADADFRVRTAANTHSVYVQGNTGNVGIGTSSPQNTLDLSSTSPQIRLDDTDAIGYSKISGSGGNIYLQADEGNTVASSKIDFRVDGSQRMVIDDSGRVGIGRVPSLTNSKLEVGGADNVSLINVEASGVTGGMGIGSTGLQFFHGSSAKMRIDASGNLLVGKTAVGTNTAGFEARSTGFIGVTRADVGAYFTRLTTDGEIIQFRKDGTTVGSIGTDAGRFKVKSNSLALYLENESNKTLIWGNVSSVPYFYPQSDNDTNIGYPTQRFKDLYLSGGVYLGGTGAANLLDDYEEGTWTPVVSGSSSTSGVGYAVQQGHYTKVGNMVTANFSIAFNDKGSMSGTTRITGLPFTGNNAPQQQHVSMATANMNVDKDQTVVAIQYAVNALAYLYVQESGLELSQIVGNSQYTDTSKFIGSLTYFTTS